MSALNVMKAIEFSSVHRSAALIAAKASGTSLNQWAAKVLGNAAHA